MQFKKEFAGILFLALYFLALPGVLAKTLLKRFYESMDFARYSVLVWPVSDDVHAAAENGVALDDEPEIFRGHPVDQVLSR